MLCPPTCRGLNSDPVKKNLFQKLTLSNLVDCGRGYDDFLVAQICSLTLIKAGLSGGEFFPSVHPNTFHRKILGSLKA